MVFLLRHFDRDVDSYVPLFNHKSDNWLCCQTTDWNTDKLVYMALSMRELRRPISRHVQLAMLKFMDVEKVAKKAREDFRLGGLILLALHNWDEDAIGKDGFCIISPEE